MNTDLVRKLVSLGVIRQNTEIEATYRGVDLAGIALPRITGTFFVQGIRISKTGSILFDAESTVDGIKKTFSSIDVSAIDGMPISKLTGIYGINTSGDAVAQGKRRGRRPRAKVLTDAITA